MNRSAGVSPKCFAMEIKGIIFDYGGTIDSRGVHWSEIIWDAYLAAEVPVSKEQFRDAYVFAERELATTRHILPHHTFSHLMHIKVGIELRYLVENELLTESYASGICARIADYCYDAALAAVESARPTLESLAAHYPMVLVSNFYGNISSVLADFRLDRYFRQVIESAVVGIRKPDPAIFRLGVEALGLRPEEVLVVGDSYKKDILPARSIGCRVAWLKGKGWTEADDAVVDPAAIESLDRVLDMV